MKRYKKKQNLYVKVVNRLCLIGACLGWVTDWAVTDYGTIHPKHQYAKPINKKQRLYLKLLYRYSLPRVFRPKKVPKILERKFEEL